MNPTTLAIALLAICPLGLHASDSPSDRSLQAEHGWPTSAHESMQHSLLPPKDSFRITFMAACAEGNYVGALESYFGSIYSEGKFDIVSKDDLVASLNVAVVKHEISLVQFIIQHGLNAQLVPESLPLAREAAREGDLNMFLTLVPAWPDSSLGDLQEISVGPVAEFLSAHASHIDLAFANDIEEIQATIDTIDFPIITLLNSCADQRGYTELAAFLGSYSNSALSNLFEASRSKDLVTLEALLKRKICGHIPTFKMSLGDLLDLIAPDWGCSAELYQLISKYPMKDRVKQCDYKISQLAEAGDLKTFRALITFIDTPSELVLSKAAEGEFKQFCESPTGMALMAILDRDAPGLENVLYDYAFSHDDQAFLIDCAEHRKSKDLLAILKK